MSQEIRRLARDLRAHLDWHAALGVEEIALGDPLAAAPQARSEPSLGRPAVAAASPSESPPAAAVAAAPSPASSSGAPGVAQAADLAGLRAAMGDCRLCRLCERRTQIVFGVGNPNARVVFVGEGPGHDEDVKGEPFVGRAGQLLTDIIEKGMRLRRSDVYICNVVKCRPPENRNPEPDEVAACAPFLTRQIELVGPEVLVTLGKFAAQALLQTKTPITRLRGTWQEYRGTPVMPTFHPAYLLRNPADKKLVWQDIKQVMARLGLAT